MIQRTDALGELSRGLRRLTRSDLVRAYGTVTSVADGRITVAGLSQVARLGDRLVIDPGGSEQSAIVARLDEDAIIAVPVRPHERTRIGDTAYALGSLTLSPDESWRGRTIDPLGRALDGGAPLTMGTHQTPLDRQPPPALARKATGPMVRTGVTAIDVFTPLCEGQRIGIFAGSGVGKSTLLGMLARARCDLVVICLVGERGREVRDFLEHLHASARDAAICVVATSDDSAVVRRMAPRSAMAIAEYFRDRGYNVGLIMDSLTRFAHAHREFAMAAGEPPVARGYPPSVFRELASLLERAGPGSADQGSITLVATVLVDGDDHNDPVADAVRGIIDGHVMLDRNIGAGGRWPAIDLLGSLSRLADTAWTAQQAAIVRRCMSLISRFEETRELRALGEYRPNADPLLDQAVRVVPQIYAAITQRKGDVGPEDPFSVLAQLTGS